MNFEVYMKQEIEKTLFIEINEDLTLSLKGNPVLCKGEYPISSEDLIKIGKHAIESLTPAMLVDGMLNIIACDVKFKYSNKYISFLRGTYGIESYIIMKINEAKDKHLKKSLIFTTALNYLFPRKEYEYNRIILLMKLYELTNQSFLEEEIVKSLEIMIGEYPDFTLPFFHLGKYYLDKDIDRAKLLLRNCLNDKETLVEATNILNRIACTEKYDEAVEYVKNGLGEEALELLAPICSNNPEDLDAKYYMAVALRQIGNNTEALMYLRELTNLAERPGVYSEIALNLAMLKDFQSAIEYFKKALKITPDDSGIISNVGVCQLNLGQIEEAKKTFELAIRINPKDEIAAEWLLDLNAKSKKEK